jgi:hypothetical protein
VGRTGGEQAAVTDSDVLAYSLRTCVQVQDNQTGVFLRD